jgi:hypothetical protein
MGCLTHFTSYCGPCQPLFRAFSRFPPRTVSCQHAHTHTHPSVCDAFSLHPYHVSRGMHVAPEETPKSLKKALTTELYELRQINRTQKRPERARRGGWREAAGGGAREWQTRSLSAQSRRMPAHHVHGSMSHVEWFTLEEVSVYPVKGESFGYGPGLTDNTLNGRHEVPYGTPVCSAYKVTTCGLTESLLK